MRLVARVCRHCQQTAKQKPCEHCGNPKPKQKTEYRGSSTSRGYGYKWQQWRAAILKRMASTGEWDGSCDRCKKLIVGMIHCDHIKPVIDAKDPLFYDRKNIQFLHPACHSQKTAEDKRKGLTR